MIAEAIDTLITLGWWALGWIVVLSVVATTALLTLAVFGSWAAAGLWRATRPTWARGRARAWLHARRTRDDYEEAA